MTSPPPTSPWCAPSLGLIQDSRVGPQEDRPYADRLSRLPGSQTASVLLCHALRGQIALAREPALVQASVWSRSHREAGRPHPGAVHRVLRTLTRCCSARLGRYPVSARAWSQEPLDLEYLIPRFDKAGVRFAEADGTIDLGTDSGRLAARILIAAAENAAELWETLDISRKRAVIKTPDEHHAALPGPGCRRGFDPAGVKVAWRQPYAT